MKQQNKLRNTLREYYDNQQVPFDDNEWERAGAYLSAARRGRRIRATVLIFTIIVSALIIVLFNVPKLTSDNKHQASALPNKTLKSAPGRQSAVLRAPSVSEPKTGIRVNSSSAIKSGHSTTLVAAPESSRKIPEVKADFFPGKTPQIFESGIAEAAPESVEQRSIVNEENAIDNNSAVTPVTSSGITASDNNEQDEIKREVPENLKENTEIVPAAVESPAHIQDEFQTKETPQVPIKLLPQTAATVTLNDHKKEIAVTGPTTFAIPQEAILPAITDTARHVSFTNTITDIEIESVDTVSGLPSLNRLAEEGIFFEAGAAWHYGWKGPVNRDACGFTPVAGLSYMSRINNRYSFSFGLRYLQVRNLLNGSRTSRVSTYKYGEQSRVTVITPSTVHYLVAPLRLHYYADDKNSFGAGINLAYLLNVDATVTSYDERPGFSENYRAVKLGGYTEGFSWFDSQLAFLYRRRIGSSLGLQAEIFIGLTDVKQDAFFGFSNKERNSGAKLSLIYYAFRKKR